MNMYTQDKTEIIRMMETNYHTARNLKLILLT